jgi:hypothetical protein
VSPSRFPAVVFAVAVVLAWRGVLEAPNGDINRLLVATVAGGLGLALLAAARAWLKKPRRLLSWQVKPPVPKIVSADCQLRL